MLKIKIEKGGFVELERLLVKDRFKRKSEDNRLAFYYKDGQSYLAPPENDSARISGIRKWEKAF